MEERQRSPSPSSTPSVTTPSRKKRKRSATSAGSDSSDVELVAGPSCAAPSASRRSSSTKPASLKPPSSRAKTKSPTGEQDAAPSDGVQVQCPACQRFMDMGDINAHLDRGCKDPPEGKRAAKAHNNGWSNLFGGNGKGKERYV
jgi:E3 ubiquitin-protein ligase RAD18